MAGVQSGKQIRAKTLATMVVYGGHVCCLIEITNWRVSAIRICVYIYVYMYEYEYDPILFFSSKGNRLF